MEYWIFLSNDCNSDNHPIIGAFIFKFGWKRENAVEPLGRNEKINDMVQYIDRWLIYKSDRLNHSM